MDEEETVSLLALGIAEEIGDLYDGDRPDNWEIARIIDKARDKQVSEAAAYCAEYPNPPGADAMFTWWNIQDKPHKGPKYIQEALDAAYKQGQDDAAREEGV